MVTGQIASEQVRLMAGDDHFEIVGAVCHHQAKHGRDLGELVGIGHLGVKVTSDPDEALTVDADVVLYNPLGPDVDLVRRMLSSGKNVISILGPWDATPGSADYARLDEAARAARVTFHGAGNMPGMLNDVVPTMLSGWTSDVRHVWTRERSYHGAYRGKEALETFLGYGRPLDQHGPATAPGGLLVGAYVSGFDQAHHSMARALGVLGEGSGWDTRLTDYQAVAAPEAFTIDACGLDIAKGTVAGFRYEITSFLGDQPWATTEVEHVARLGLGPQWRATLAEPEFTVRIKGRPTLELVFGTVPDEHDTEATMGLVELNAARLVNLVPAVAEASPGAKTFAELPIVTPVRRST